MDSPRPYERRARRARKWRAKLHYGPGAVADQPNWERLTMWTKPVGRRTMRKKITEALADPTLERIEVYQVDD